MNRLRFDRLLFVCADDGTSGSDASRDLIALSRVLPAADIELVTVTDRKLGGYLKQVKITGEVPAIICLAPNLRNLAAVTRQLRAVAAQSHLVYLSYSDRQEEFQRQFHYVPRAGLHWSMAAMDSDILERALQDALAVTQRRARFNNSLEKANRQIRSLGDAGQKVVRPRVVSDHYLANILAQAQDAIVAVDTAFRVLYWSAGAERLFRQSRRTVAEVEVKDLPFWTPGLQAGLEELAKGSNTYNSEATCILGGEVVSLDIVSSAVRDDSGGFIGASMVIRDVSERNRLLQAERNERARAARALDSERRHLRTLFHQAPGFIAVMVGPRHVFEVANDAYYQVVGHRSILGRPVSEALPEVQGQEFLALLDRVYATGESHVGRGMPLAIQRQPGAELETVYVDFVFQPIVEADGAVTGIFCQGSDVTEHKRTQEKLALHQTELENLVAERTQALEASQQALQRSQKLEAIGQLTGGVAHDFNNVLQIIAGNLQLLQLELHEHKKLERYLGSAVEAVDRGAKLSSQLLAFARRQPLQPLPVNLSRVLREMDDLLRRALGETVAIETVVGGGLWNTLVDPHQLENVILNLSINARDAMPEGGRLTLEVGNALLDDQYVMHEPDIPAGQYVMLAISDTGKGMPPEVLERAFDPFFTTKPEGEGTGLGLSMAYGFIKQSGGHIKIYSEVGSGTTFKIYLPRSDQPEAENFTPLAGPVTGGTETILVVEDDPAVQETAVRVLSDLGYKVLKASDGQSALNILQSGVAIDMLFTDVVMPGALRSPDLARQAKQLFPDIAVLFTSGYTQNAIVHGGRLDPGVELLSKPYRREDLARKVRHLLGRRKQGATERSSKRQMSILVVEDNEESLTAVCDLLSLLGHQTSGVGSAEEALQMLQQKDFDVLFTDINLPGISGNELVDQVRERHADIAVIIASGYGSLAESKNAVVLPKPFGLAQLREALQKAAHYSAME